MGHGGNNGAGVFAGVGAEDDWNVVQIHELGNALHGLVGPTLVVVVIQLHRLSEQAPSAVQLIEGDRIAVFVGLSERGVAAS